ncbi:hypothetical protein EOL73_00640 [Candidatus Saccharibacteria bacterium]|nr:hypothetical protein [Candidatus Saccharibacteria bacterium]NCU40250.1 hypothetical protein [Candidatus Saccharibacteria bacterium]
MAVKTERPAVLNLLVSPEIIVGSPAVVSESSNWLVAVSPFLNSVTEPPKLFSKYRSSPGSLTEVAPGPFEVGHPPRKVSV